MKTTNIFRVIVANNLIKIYFWKMIKNLLILLPFIFFTSNFYGQNKEYQNYHSPLGIPLILASNFGELRPNHFHMGVDFKTKGKTGYNLYSIEEGYVSRIKVSPYGYGKVVYIDHPNGITSVYAHCREFKGQLDSLVTLTQEKEQNYAIEIFPSPNKIKVTKGQVFAVSGNSGSSTAPHLHFEIRETKTEHALNPLVYGFDIADHKKPEIRGVKIYGLTERGYQYAKKSVKKVTKKGSENYYISENKISIPSHFLSKSGGIGFAFDVIDRLDGAGNQCGLYGSILIINGDTIFGQETNRVPFESTRYVNSHKDYYEYAHLKRKYHKTFRTEENTLPIYIDDGLGLFHPQPGGKYNIHYIAYDTKGNTGHLKFELNVLDGPISKLDKIEKDSTYLSPSKSMEVKKNNVEVEFGTTTTYEPIQINPLKIETKIGHPEIPVQRAYKIKIKHNGLQDGKHYLDILTARGRHKSVNVIYDDNLMIFEPKYFGTYSVKRDSTPPVITPNNFSSSTAVLNNAVLKWKISDKETGINDYDLFIDGKWVLLEYDAKRAMIKYQRDLKFKGQKELLLIVKDDCGNIKEWKTSILFK